MRRESSTVVVLVGEADGEAEGELMAGLARSNNVSLVRAPAAGAGQPDGGEPAAAASAASRSRRAACRMWSL